jgi:WD40 repeat protein
MKTVHEEAPAPEPARGHDVFVSYSRADRPAIVSLTRGLIQHGKRAWVDLEDIPPSAEWMAEIKTAIESADGYLVVISPDLARSPVCTTEFEHARSSGKRIVPVQVRSTDPTSVPEALAALNWIDATEGATSDVIDRIVRALDTDLEQTRAHTRLLVRASEWTSRGEPRSLLLRGEDLEEAESVLVAAQGKEPAPTPAQARFVQASRRGASKRQRSVIAIAVCVALVASALGLVTLQQRNEANAQRAVADRNAAESRSRELAAASIGQLSADPELSLILATQAMDVAQTSQATDALRQAFTESRVRATLRGFGGPVETVRFAPHGDRVLAASSDGTGRIWDPSSSSKPIVLSGHRDLIDSAVFSNDGSLVVTASFDGTARLWNASTGAELVTLRGHDGAVNDAAFNPNGSLVVTAGEDGTARVWNTQSGEQLRVLSGHDRPIYDVSFSPDGALIVTASDDDTARIWDAKNGKLLHVLRGHADGLYTAAFDPRGRHVVTASQDGTAKVWDVGTGKLEATLDGHQGPVVEASFAPDGRSIVTASEDKTARIWDPKSGRQLQVLRGHQDQLNSADFSPDGRLVITTSLDGTARVWNPQDGSSVAVLRGHDGPVLAAAFSPDSHRVVTGGQDGTARVWEPSTEATLYSGASSSSAADPQARIVATTNFDGSVHVASTETGKELWSADVGVAQTGVAVSGDAKLVVSGGLDGVGHVWDAKTGRSLGELHGHGHGYFSADFYGTQHVLTWSDDGTARLWDPRSGKQLAVFDHGGPIWEAHLSADGMRVLTTGKGGGVVRMWDVATGKQLWSHSGLLGPPAMGGAISPDGTMVGTVSSQAVIWDAATGRKLAVLNDRLIRGLGFSPDSKTVLSRSADGGARIWDPHTGQLLLAMVGPSEVNGVAFSVDGGWVVTAGKEDKIRVWDSQTGQLVATFQGAGGEGLYGLFANDGRSVVSFSDDGILLDRCDACGAPDELLRLAEKRITRPLTQAEQASYLGTSSGSISEKVPGQPAGLNDAQGNPVPDGGLAPGTYSAVGFSPKISFTLRDGWFAQTFVDYVRPPEVQLGQLVQLQRVDSASNGLTLLYMDPGRVIDGNKLWDERRNIEPFPNDLAAWFANQPNFEVLKRGSRMVDGIDGTLTDTLITSIPNGAPWPNCGGCTTDIAMSLNNMTGPIGNNLIMAGGPGEIDRWIVLRSEGGTIVVDAWSASQQDFRAFIPVVDQVLRTVTIGG